MSKMVFVINTSLKMSPGKLASQTAHAALSLFIKAKKETKKQLLFFDQMDWWLLNGQKKVVLKGIDDIHLTNLESQAKNLNILSILIKDAGRTQITPGSITCLGLFGKEDQINQITGNLNLLN